MVLQVPKLSSVAGGHLRRWEERLFRRHRPAQRREVWKIWLFGSAAVVGPVVAVVVVAWPVAEERQPVSTRVSRHERYCGLEISLARELATFAVGATVTVAMSCFHLLPHRWSR